MNTAPDLIRRGDPLPYYAQLADILREQIGRAEYRPGDLLPAESELCATFALSRTVVRQALDELVAEGLVRKEKGRGTFVAQPKIADLVVHELKGFTEEMAGRGFTVQTQVLRNAIVPVPQRVAEALGIPTSEQVVHIARVRSIDGEPIVKTDTFLPAARFRDLVDAPVETESLYDLLDKGFGVKPRGGWRRIEAIVASRDLADTLGIDVGSPVLELRAVTTEADGTPFEHFRAAYRGDRASLEIKV